MTKTIIYEMNSARQADDELFMCLYASRILWGGCGRVQSRLGVLIVKAAYLPNMEYFGASIQTRNAGHRHHTRRRANIMAEVKITIRLIIVLRSPAVGYRENARIRQGRAFDLH